MQEDEPKDDFAEYRREIERIEIDQGQWVDVNRQAAFDYGQFTIKNGLLVSGGAFLATPALLSISPNFDPAYAAGAALGFGCSSVAWIICSYLVHINFRAHHDTAWAKKSLAERTAFLRLLPTRNWNDIDDKLYQKLTQRGPLIIRLTHIAVHLSGIVALLALIYGGINLYIATAP